MDRARDTDPDQRRLRPHLRQRARTRPPLRVRAERIRDALQQQAHDAAQRTQEAR
jgi:hypothetical protein